MIKRYLCYAEGRVQGVGFRSFCMLNARKLNLTGYAKNLPNGLVEIQVQGEDASIMSFFQIVKAGDRWIRVDDFSSKSIPIVENEKSFSYGYGDSWY